MKKLFSVSLLLTALIANVAFAQDSTKVKTPVSYGPLKTFGGAKQYSAWSFGISGGGLAPVSGLGGLNQFSSYKIQLGYSAFLKWQLQHSFGIKAEFLGGKFDASNAASSQNPNYSAGNTLGGTDVNSTLQYAVSIQGEVDVASIDFLRRQNAVRVYIDGGYGLAGAKPDLYGTTVKAGFVPVGLGLKIKASNNLAINVGYKMIYFDASNILGTPNGRSNKASYGSVGLEYTFGHKPAMIWTNPVAVLYDELKANDSLAKEVTAVKNRVTTVEGDVSNLKKDSDGDGVSDVFDKCPNTPAGTKVDGAGCELPKPEVIMAPAPKVETQITKEDIQVVRAAIKNLNFETNKTIIKSGSFQYLDKLADLLAAKPGAKLSLKGYTDSKGESAHNLQLSTGRASAIKDYLVQKGIDGSRITAEGFGASNPVATNKTAAGRAKNRRVEFNLY
jgi:OOP family OmpA-OmpF porin